MVLAWRFNAIDRVHRDLQKEPLRMCISLSIYPIGMRESRIPLWPRVLVPRQLEQQRVCRQLVAEFRPFLRELREVG
jgi:hypothetical protein